MKNSRSSEITQRMARKQYQYLGKGIDIIYKEIKAGCESFVGDARNVCFAEAESTNNVVRAALDAHYKTPFKIQYATQILKADTDFSQAMEHCEELSGDAKDYCVRDARADKAHQIISARAQMAAAKNGAMSNQIISRQIGALGRHG